MRKFLDENLEEHGSLFYSIGPRDVKYSGIDNLDVHDYDKK